MLQISRQSIQARTSYSDFKKCCEKKKKNTKKIRRTLQVHISGKLGGFSSNLELEVPHPEGIHTENFVCFCSGSVELQMHENGIFFTPVKYTLVCRASLVSWAARHTTVCLDTLHAFSYLTQLNNLEKYSLLSMLCGKVTARATDLMVLLLDIASVHVVPSAVCTIHA